MPLCPSTKQWRRRRTPDAKLHAFKTLELYEDGCQHHASAVLFLEQDPSGRKDAVPYSQSGCGKHNLHCETTHYVISNISLLLHFSWVQNWSSGLKRKVLTRPFHRHSSVYTGRLGADEEIRQAYWQNKFSAGLQTPVPFICIQQKTERQSTLHYYSMQ